MERITGGRLLARALKRQGVNCIFSLSGDMLNPLYDASLEEGIRIIDFRHEQAAVHAADGFARATGRPAVAAVTGGPGVTNAVTGLANAFHGGSPLLLIGGRRPLAEADRGAFGEQDALALVSPVTRWARTVYEAARLPEYVGRALTAASAGRPGPVFLEVPADLLQQEVEGQAGGDRRDVGDGRAVRDGRDGRDVRSHVSTGRSQGDPRLVERAARLLLESRRPMVLAGSGVWWAQAGDELKRLIEASQAPLCAIRLGRGSVPEDHPLSLGPFKGGLREADLVLLLGTRLDWALDFGRLINSQALVVQVDVEAGEIGHNSPVDVGILGDVGQVLEQLNQAMEGASLVERGPWIGKVQEMRSSFLEGVEKHARSEASPVHPLRLCRELAGFLGRDFTLALDGGEVQIWAAMALGVYRPGRWLDSGAFGCLGMGLPFALAARLARPAERVLLLTGDGSFGFSAMEIDSAVRQDLPVVVVIANDGAWGLIKHMQEETYGRERVVATELGWVRYDRMAEALGGHGEFVEYPGDIRPALERAFASGRPAVVNVKCDPNVESPFGKRFLA